MSDDRPRSRIIRAGASKTVVLRPARMDAELRTSPFASAERVDSRLTDPHLERVVDDARAKAAEAGYEAGYASGRAEGLAAAAEQARDAAQAAEAAARAAEAARQEILKAAVATAHAAAEEFRRKDATAVAQIEDLVVDLALRVAAEILGREIETATNPGAEAIARALALAPDSVPATARLHPVDAAALGDAAALAPGRSLAVVADPTVERGGCVVEAGGRQIDAQIGPALDRVAKALR